MSLLTLNNLTVRFGSRTVLDGVTAAVDDGARIGLVGRNGTGKTTLLRVLTGALAPDSGSVTARQGLRVGWLEQHPSFDEGPTVYEVARSAFAHVDALQAQLTTVFEQMASASGEALEGLMARQADLESRLESAGGWVVDHRVEATLHGLGLGDEMFQQQAARLSGGERSRLALARLLLESPDVLLLDEPSNHLDLEGRRWLETFIRDTYAGAVVIVSHDRWMLDQVCTSILELRRGRMEAYPGNYSTFTTLREERRLTEARAWEKQQDHVRREQAFIRRYKAGQRAKQARGREGRLQRFIEQSDLERPEQEAVAAMHLPPAARCGDIVLRTTGLTVRMGDRTLVEDLDLQVTRGDRLGIVGSNGTGKTSLVRCLLGEVEQARGDIDHGAGLDIGWFRQMQDHLDGQYAVWEFIQSQLARGLGEQATEQQARDLAGAFLFSGDDQDRLLGSLSGGERARAALAGLMGCGHNVLVLDEPTNHIDLASTERLEAVLSSTGPFTGTLILISHDRALLESTCDRLLILEGDGRCHQHPGRISSWLDRPSSGRTASTTPGKQVPMAPKRPRVSPLERLSQGELESRIEQIEVRLGELDSRSGLEEVWSDPEAMRALADEQQALRTTLTPLEAEWSRRIEGEGG